MSKLPAYQWYPGDWKKDPAVQALCPEARAFWREAIDALHESETRGTLTATVNGWARITGVPVEWVEMFIEENECYETADATNCNGRVTLVSRRIQRDEIKREKARKRVQKHRAKEDVTPPKRKSNTPSSSSSSSSVSITSSKKNKTVSAFQDDFCEWWKGYPNKQGKTSATRYYTHWRTKENKTREGLLTGRDRYIATKQGQKDPVFSHGSTFLNPSPQSDSANISDFMGDDYEPPRGATPDGLDGKLYGSDKHRFSGPR